MTDDLRAQLEILERTIADFEKASKLALGFTATIEYRGVSFNVSRRFVIADLSPLAFFHLGENIDDSAEGAIVRLYERLSPLLSCRHQWVVLRRADDEHIRTMSRNNIHGDPRPHICKSCTAYALDGPLPVIGRTLA